MELKGCARNRGREQEILRRGEGELSPRDPREIPVLGGDLAHLWSVSRREEAPAGGRGAQRAGGLGRAGPLPLQMPPVKTIGRGMLGARQGQTLAWNVWVGRVLILAFTLLPSPPPRCPHSSLVLLFSTVQYSCGSPPPEFQGRPVTENSEVLGEKGAGKVWWRGGQRLR